MVLCKYYLDGLECPFLQKCQDEHLDVRQFIKSEMESAINGDQWPLSSFGPFTDKPSISNYIEDQSFEEVRLLYYGYNNLNFFQSSQQFTKAITDAKMKMKTLLTMNPEVMDVLIDLYDNSDSSKGGIQPKNNPFSTPYSPQHSDSFATSSAGTHNAFGGATGLFGATSGGGFLGGAQKSVLGQNVFGTFGCQPQAQGTGFFGTQQHFGFQQPLQQLQLLGNPFEGNAFAQTAQQTSTAGRSHDDSKLCLKELSAKMDNILKVVNENKAAIKMQEKEIKSMMDSIKNLAVSNKKNENELVKHGENKKAHAKAAVTKVPPLIIKPKHKQNSAKTRNDIKENIDPLYLSIQINSISDSLDGSIIIKCKNDESVKKIEKEVREKCGDNYDVNFLKLASPKIMVSGIDNEVDEDDLIEIIRKQNQLNGEMKLIKCFEKVSTAYKYNAIIEVNKDFYRMLMEDSDPYLNIGWNRCYLNDSFNVRRCFNCWGFNHNARNCRSETKCPKCGGEHTDADCKSYKLRCTNCTKANVRLNLKLDVRHDTRNYNCHVYLKKLEKERDMIDY